MAPSWSGEREKVIKNAACPKSRKHLEFSEVDVQGTLEFSKFHFANRSRKVQRTVETEGGRDGGDALGQESVLGV